ncbi:yod1 [Symbiodinium natans]|uniref:Yod1 protein n=1 Tax=Symbiodinium natans TaxID=878477 RepID=A0A812LBU0_9DINO|nr:yod1 [Symbiodinium natans]
MQVLCYGSDLPNSSARIYLLYTGQHYDPIVSGAAADVSVEQEQKKQKKGDASLDVKALELARQHVAEAAKKAKQRRAKKIKCGGCGALLGDAEAFATHCGEVDHDDDFAYDCEEVEVVIEEGDELPEGTVDLNADHIYSFSNTGKDPLCHAFPAAVTIAGFSFPSMEHYWQAAPFIGGEEALVRSIAAAATVDEALILAGGAAPSAQRSDFRERRLELLAEGLKAKARPSACNITV